MSFFLLLFNFISLFLIVNSQVKNEDSFDFVHPESCNLRKNQTFSLTELTCVKCQSHFLNSQKSSGLPNCPCKRPKDISSQFEDVCLECPSNQVSYDQKTCSPCGSDIPFDTSIGRCKICPEGNIQIFSEQNGAPRETVECLECGAGYWPSSNGLSCVPCHPSFLTEDDKSENGSKTGCKCPGQTHRLTNGVCFENSEIKEYDVVRINLNKMEFSKVGRIESAFLKDNLLTAYYLCRGNNNETACQLLANLCTLQLHSFSEETTACYLYKQLQLNLPRRNSRQFGGRDSSASTLPKLYYDQEAPSILQRSSAIPIRFNMMLNQPQSDINFTVTQMDIKGKFLGLANLLDILPCKELPHVQRPSTKFGTTYSSNCKFSLRDYWDNYKDKMHFYDPYLSYEAEGVHKLFAVPINIQQFRKRGSETNKLEDKYQWNLVRRFFILDSVGGQENSETPTEFPRIVRYLESVHILIQLQNSGEPGRIYLPLITLNYNEATSEQLRRGDLISFNYKVEHIMDMSRSIEDVKISIGVISSLAVIWAALQSWSWSRRSGRREIDLGTFLNLVFSSCGYLADAFFIVSFSTAFYWFLFFKKQVAVHVLLPQPDQERIIRDLLISAFSLKIVEIIQLIWRQSEVDIFLIDWERPRAKNSIPVPNNNKSKGESGEKREKGEKERGDSASVSIWRTYFIANEFAEIQSSRKIHVASQILISIFFLETLGFKYWGLSWADGSLYPGDTAKNINYSTSARFAVSSLIFLIIGIIQWIYKVGFYERFGSNKIQDFIDICTLSNVSVFILAARQFGYYVHGRNVHGFADTDMETMIEQLNREEENLCGRRGLLPQTDQQTFVISVPNKFRAVYDEVLKPLYTSSGFNPFMKNRQIRFGSKTNINLSGKPNGTLLNLSVNAYHSMNRFLTAFLEKALSDMDYDVKDKSFFESVFDMEFGDLTNDRAVFYNDNGHSFDSVLFYGNERALFLFNLYTFIFVEILSHNFLLAGIITYFTNMLINNIRDYFGKRNLARKTMIDGRFLI